MVFNTIFSLKIGFLNWTKTCENTPCCIASSTQPSIARKSPLQPSNIIINQRKRHRQLISNRKPPAQPKTSENSKSIPSIANASHLNGDKSLMEPKKNILHQKRQEQPQKRKTILGNGLQKTNSVIKNHSSQMTSSFVFPGAFGTIQVPHSITQILRPHQVEGIVFLWNCLTGSSPSFQQVYRSQMLKSKEDVNAGLLIDEQEHLGRKSGENEERLHLSRISYTCKEKFPRGAILADEMGLGKTLMTISIILALYRQNRFQVTFSSP